MNFDDLCRFMNFDDIKPAARSTVVVDYDSRDDVLCVRRSDATDVATAEAPYDGAGIYLSSDASGVVVLVTIMAASGMPVGLWPTHPDRGLMPPDLLDAIDTWVRAHGRGAV